MLHVHPGKAEAIQAGKWRGQGVLLQLRLIHVRIWSERLPGNATGPALEGWNIILAPVPAHTLSTIQEQAADKFRYITYGTLDNPEKLPPKGEFFCKDRASWMPEIPGAFLM